MSRARAAAAVLVLAATAQATACEIGAMVSDAGRERQTRSMFRLVAAGEPGEAQGAAFLVDRELGLFVTAAHVVGFPTDDDDCQLLTPDTLRIKGVGFSIDIDGDGAPDPLELAALSMCDDLAVLKGDPALVRANPFDLAFETIPSSEIPLNTYIHSAEAPHDPAQAAPLDNLGLKLVTAGGGLDARCQRRGGRCLHIAGEGFQNGVSGSPVTDGHGRVLGVIVKRSATAGQGWAVPTSFVWSLVERAYLTHHADAQGAIEAAARDIARVAVTGAPIAQERFMETEPALRLALGMREIARRPGDFGIAAEHIACPLLFAARERLLHGEIVMALTVAQDAMRRQAALPGQSYRAHLRATAEDYARRAAEAERSGDEPAASELRAVALAGLRLGIEETLRSDDGHAMLAAITAPAPAGATQPVPLARGARAAAADFVLVSGETGGPVAARAAEVLVDDAPFDEMRGVIGELAAALGLRPSRGGVAAQAEPLRVARHDGLAAMLREYADLAIVQRRAPNDPETDGRLAATARGAAFWAVRLARTDASIAASHRVHGDALWAEDRHGDALTAYARGLLTARADPLGGQAAALEARFAEAAARASTGLPTIDMRDVVTLARRPVVTDAGEVVRSLSLQGQGPGAAAAAAF